MVRLRLEGGVCALTASARSMNTLDTRSNFAGVIEGPSWGAGFWSGEYSKEEAEWRLRSGLRTTHGQDCLCHERLRNLRAGENFCVVDFCRWLNPALAERGCRTGIRRGGPVPQAEVCAP